MLYIDRILICRDCSTSFTFSSGEQSFYAARGLLNDPQRCPACRSARRNGNGGSGSGSNYVHYGPSASFGGRNPRQMHPAVCSSCGQVTEVPFVPRENRPVFCTECFLTARRGDENGGRLSASA
jgi:CxxC-x17-CxxC domain-containing protein